MFSGQWRAPAVGEAGLLGLVQEGRRGVEKGVQDVHEDEVGEADVDLVAAGLLDGVVVVGDGGQDAVDYLDALFLILLGVAYLVGLAQVGADGLAHAEVLYIPVFGDVVVNSIGDLLVGQLESLGSLKPPGQEVFEVLTLKAGELKQFTIDVSHFLPSLRLSTKLSILVARGAVASREYS